MASNGGSDAIIVYGYLPAWGVPCISPYVTKLVNYLTFTGQKFEYRSLDLAKLDTDTPHGKLPIIVDGDTKVGDSNTIIQYLKKKYGDKLDSDLSQSDRAVALAFNRLIEEHLYFAGVLASRWKSDSGWQTYIPFLAGTPNPPPEALAGLEGFRTRIVAEYDGQGMGRRSQEVVLEFYKADIDALSDFLGDKKYFMGDKVRSIDASVYAILAHLHKQPHKWLGTGYVESKKNLVDYIERLHKEFNV